MVFLFCDKQFARKKDSVIIYETKTKCENKKISWNIYKNIQPTRTQDTSRTVLSIMKLEINVHKNKEMKYLVSYKFRYCGVKVKIIHQDGIIFKCNFA